MAETQGFRVGIEDYILDIAALQDGLPDARVPLVLIDLERVPPECNRLASLVDLPPCPVIGLGDSDHPLAASLDCVVEAPVRAESLLAAILARPLAAGVLVQLLRTIEGMDPMSALLVESLAYATLQGGAEYCDWLGTRAPAARLPGGELHVARCGDVLSIEVDRPHARNAIDAAMRDALREAFDLAAIDATIARVELRGAGRAFGAGADLSEFGTTRDPAQAHAIRMRTLPALAAARCRSRMVSTVQGLCVGASLELAAWGRIEAHEDAIFHLPELAMGLLPGAGGCVSLSRKIGRQRTALMVLSGRRIGVRTARDWGLVDAVLGEGRTLVDKAPG